MAVDYPVAHVRRLFARDAGDRPRSALAVLDELDQLAAAIVPGSPRRAGHGGGLALGPGGLAGRADEQVIGDLARDLGEPRGGPHRQSTANGRGSPAIERIASIASIASITPARSDWPAG